MGGVFLSTHYKLKADCIALYFKYKKSDISRYKLQKSLYFLFSHYIKEFKNKDELLFKGQFEAWQYGCVMRSVLQKDKKGYYDCPKKTRSITSSYG